MHKVQRSVLVPYSAAQMFDLVADVEKYPEFMPWCGGAEVHSRSEHGMQASILISFAGLKQRFSTRNTHDYPQRIDLELVDGPFSMLVGHWVFQPLNDPPAPAGSLRVTVCHACPDGAWQRAVTLPAGATVADAV
ncbi:type II toxin-antitoxin system RatA family toxin, partial [Bordetella pertussis]|uniref:type II toxin-antitoxin system RatA family toxin n=1 Tax=Bordetella pertussis TaxID=520 RepID=UPI000681EC68